MLVSTAIETVSSTGVETQLLEALEFLRVSESGTADISPVTGLSGGPPFRLVFDFVGPGFTTIGIGSSSTFGDAVALSSGETGVSNNAIVLIGMPEPGTELLLGLGLAALASRRGSNTGRAGGQHRAVGD